MIHLLVGVAAVSGFLLVFAINLLLTDISHSHRQLVQQRLASQVRTSRTERARQLVREQDQATPQSNARGPDMNDDDSLGEPMPRRMTFARLLSEAGGNGSVSVWVRYIVAAGAIGAILAYLLMRQFVWSIPAGGLLAIAPVGWLYVARSRRLQRIRGQLPSAFDLMSRAMRAGQTMSQAIEVVADESDAPLADEFAYCFEQQKLGLSIEATLRDMARRVPLLEIRIFVLAVVIHRQTGGNLAELLDKLADVLRQRFRIQGMISALTAEGRVQASILLALPVVMLAILYLINRSYVLELAAYPWLLAVTAGFMGVGAAWMRQLIHFDF